MADSARITVPTGAAATKLAAPGVGSGVVNGDTLVLYNRGTVPVLLGGETLTVANGFGALVAGATLSVDVTEDIYGLVEGAAAGAVDVLRVR